ncbi:heavy metal translocating P-type ATPase [Oerskovia enterophila]|uniref:heavy metal translocating P-type ATPase n=1 Tax=Oerskovia enterophila TaxID=43678 RepID=UPI003397FB3A
MTTVKNLGRYPLVMATVLVAAVAGVLSLTPWSPAVPWLVSAYALAVAGWTGVGMLRDLLRGHAGIDILAVTAVTAAVVVGEHWAALVVVLMLTGGEALEDYAANRARRDLSALMSRAPATAHVLDGGSLRDVRVDDVRPGDLVVVRPAEVVPVDGELVSDRADLDESSLTGEPLPVERQRGDEVPSGGINGQQAVTLRATRSARDSQYQQIVALVEQATTSRSRTVRLADRFAVPFTLVALAVAGLAWWVSGDGTRFAEVLVVATPCPLLIAAPVAFMGGMSRAAREGVIVKSSETLERLDRARTVAFDKTGTLTHGRPALARVETTGSLGADEVLRLAASAEQYSSHVLADAVVEGARQRRLQPAEGTGAHEVPAHGVRALVAGREVVVGKRSYVAAETRTAVEPAVLQPGELAVHVAVDGVPVGALVLRDEVRAEAATTVSTLRSLGVDHVMMLTGDQRTTAEHVAAALGIDDVRAECLPLDKVEAVRDAPARPVVMVGDGVNDAPVLASADVGIAMGARGATAASDSADAVVLRDDVSAVAAAVRVSKDTLRVALQSIWVGIGLSVALMLVAALGYLPALAGAWMQEGVDLVAILWALRASRGARLSGPPQTAYAPSPAEPAVAAR